MDNTVMLKPTHHQTDKVISIHPQTAIGQVALKVINLQQQLDFYQRMLGFQLHWRRGGQAGLGAGGQDLLVLQEKTDAQRYLHTTGLYHFAVLFPDQRELARAVKRLYTLNYHNYPTDHIMTKTTYLADPEGNGIELYAESPEDGFFAIQDGQLVARRADGSPSSGREALALQALFAHLQSDDRLDDPLPDLTRIGHVHLHVHDLQQAVSFYQGIIGFDIMGFSATLGMAFLSAGGYHHHVGLNTWQGEGAPPPPQDAAGMDYVSVVLPDENSRQEILERAHTHQVEAKVTEQGVLLCDPSRNRVLLCLS